MDKLSGIKTILGKPQKKVIFLVARQLRPLAISPPPGLKAIGTFSPTLKKVLFSLVAKRPPPPLIVARPLRKELFFAASLNNELKLYEHLPRQIFVFKT